MTPVSRILAAVSVAIVSVAAAPVDAATAYVLFEAATSSSSVPNALKNRSLGNCKQLLVGQLGNEVIIHLACSETDESNPTKYLSEAVIELTKVAGIRRSTVLVIKLDQ